MIRTANVCSVMYVASGLSSRYPCNEKPLRQRLLLHIRGRDVSRTVPLQVDRAHVHCCLCDAEIQSILSPLDMCYRPAVALDSRQRATSPQTSRAYELFVVRVYRQVSYLVTVVSKYARLD